jgi:hypothetical protein
MVEYVLHVAEEIRLKFASTHIVGICCRGKEKLRHCTPCMELHDELVVNNDVVGRYLRPVSNYRLWTAPASSSTSVQALLAGARSAFRCPGTGPPA